jgi:hypothetical protein
MTHWGWQVSNGRFVDLITDEELDWVITNFLSELGLTLEELRAQAQAELFSSDKARLIWMAIERD